jgi:hypothetical protein
MAKKTPSPSVVTETAPAAPENPGDPAIATQPAPATGETVTDTPSGIEIVEDTSQVLIVAEVAPDVHRFVTDVVEGRVQAADSREACTPISKTKANAILKDVRKVFPTAQIVFVA